MTLALGVQPAVAAAANADIVCGPTAPDELSALDLAQACDLQVEITSVRTPWSSTSATDSGTLVTETSTTAKRTAVSGQWGPVSTRVVDGTPDDGRLAVAAPVFPITLSDGTPGSPLVEISRDGHTLTYDAPFDLTSPQIDGDMVTYPSVAGKGVDLVVRVNDDGTGFSTALRLADAEAAERADDKLGLRDGLTFPVTVSDGLRVTQAGTAGGLQVVDQVGRPVFAAPAPRMWDSRAGEQGPQSRLSPRAVENGTASSRGPRGWEHVAGFGVDADDPDARLTAPLPGDRTAVMDTAVVPAAPRHEVAQGAGLDADPLAGGMSPSAGAYPTPGDLTVGGQGVTGASGGFGAAADGVSQTVGLQVQPDEEMLEDSATAWPVTIDPAVTSVGSEWLMVHSPLTGQDPLEAREYMFDGNQGLGLCDVALAAGCDETPVFRLGWQFTGLDHLGMLDPGSITAASFTAYGDHSWDCNARPVELWETGEFDAASTWTSWADTFTTLLDTQTVAHKPTCDNAGWVTWDATAGAKHLAEIDQGTLTLGLRAADESDMTLGWKRYRHDAKLTIEYTPVTDDERAEGADLDARVENRVPAIEQAEADAPPVAPATEVSPAASPAPSDDPALVPDQDAPEQATTEVEVPAELTPLDPETLGGLEMAVGAPPAPADGGTPPPAAEQVRIDVADQAAAEAADVTGVLLEVTDTTPETATLAAEAEEGESRQVQVEVDYTDFADLAGADWSGRLGILRIPACHETTPEADGCQPEPVETVNDTEAEKITATLDLGSGTPPAAAAEPSSTRSPSETTDEATPAPTSSPTASASPSASTETRKERATASTSKSDALSASSEGGNDTFAITAGTSSAAGDWSATPLSAQSSWSVSGSTGGFGWSYPLTVPTPSAGPQPDLTIGYSSAALDGRVSGVNNQSSWIGDGWDLTSGYVERRYVPCIQDRDPDKAGQAANNASRKTGDLCWDEDNAYLVFNGISTELVKHDDPDTSPVEWVGKADDGTRVQQYGTESDAARSNEYWKVTTTNGTQYWFGKDDRFDGDTLVQNSRWTVPVYGNHPGEPGHATDFKNSAVHLGWRFMLDYAKDTTGGSMTYKYQVEKNRYGANNNAGDGSHKALQYTRGGTLDWITYGTRAGAESTAADGAGAVYRVDFDVAERCLEAAGCDLSTATTQQHTNWRDAPLDQRCTATTPTSSACKDVASPAFFSTKRLTAITTKVRTKADGTYLPITTVDLTQKWRDPGDGTGRILWLDRLQRTAHGRAGTDDDITFDPVRFYGDDQRPGRVNDTIRDGYPSMNRIPVTGIITETGGVVGVDYTPAQCTDANHPAPGGKITDAAQRDNTSRCFPVTWSPWGEEKRTEWFHAYLVEAITQSPGQDAALGPQMVTRYAYSGGMAWAKVTDPLVRKKDRTWSQMRGYETVTVTHGDNGDNKTVTRYLQGMGGTVAVDNALTAREAPDHEYFAGQSLVQTAYNGDTKLSRTITIQGRAETARTGSSEDGDLRVASRTTRQDAYSATYRNDGVIEYLTRTDTTFNEYGLPVTVDDHGELGTEPEETGGEVEEGYEAPDYTGDDLCTRTTYLVNASKHLVLPQQTETVSTACGNTPTRPDEVVSASRMSYDDGAYGQAPTKGLLTASTSLDPNTGTFTGDSPVSTATYDAKGRISTTTDALGRTTRTDYGEYSWGLATTVQTISPDPDGDGPLTAHRTQILLDFVLGLPAGVIDANNKVTWAEYDAAGRITSITYPDREGKSPNAKYSYTTSASGVNAIRTQVLGADGETYHTQVELFDGLLRPIQTQTDSMDGHADAVAGSLVTQIEYDQLGRVYQTTSPWYIDSRPAMKLKAISDVPDATTRFAYDQAGRTTAEILYLGNPDNPDYEAWRTRTHYDGATVTVVPPDGGIPTQTSTDARGHTISLTQYLRDPREDTAADTYGEIKDLPAQTTRYRYDAAGQLVKVLDPEGNAWTYTYDYLGRQTKTVDPDAGTTATTYDAAGQPLTVTDAAGDTLAYTYDALGRRTTLRNDTPTGEVRARWYFDKYHAEAGDKAGQVVKGQATASVRYQYGESTLEYVRAVTGFDDAYRPLGSVTVVPSTNDDSSYVHGRYETSQTYTADGQVKTFTYPAAGNLNKETVTTHYNSASLPEWMGGGFGWGTYVATSRFDVYGRLTYMDLGNTYGAVVSHQYQEGTGRLIRTSLDRERIGGTELDQTWTYDDAGNITSVKDVPTATGRVADRQCYQYDALRRLTEAWTPATGNCDAARSIPALGGAAPYWQSFEYDAIGNRTSETFRTPGGGTDGGLTTTTDYAYAGSQDRNGDGDTTDPGEHAGPHAVTSTETTSPEQVLTTTYTYDDAGRLTAEAGATDYLQVERILRWDAEHELTEAETATTVWPEPEATEGDDGTDGDQSDPAPVDPGPGETTTGSAGSFYDADGNRLTRTNATETGTSSDVTQTLYLPGGMEIHADASGTLTATRYYTFAGQTVAMRTANGLSGVTSLVNDPHGTTIASVHNTNWTTSSVNKHYTLPYGAQRGGAAMPSDHHFLGKIKDAGGLTLIGARWYDQDTGRFLSVDPIMSLADPGQWNGYAYASSNPVTYADPSGLLAGPGIDPYRHLVNRPSVIPKSNVTKTTPKNPQTPKPPKPPTTPAKPPSIPRTVGVGGGVGVVTTTAAATLVLALAIVVLTAQPVGDGTCGPARYRCVDNQVSVDADLELDVEGAEAPSPVTQAPDPDPGPADATGGGNAGNGDDDGGNVKTTFADPADDEPEGNSDADDLLAEARALRDALGVVKQPLDRYKERPAVFIGAYDEATGEVRAFHSEIGGQHAEEVARTAMPNARFTEPAGWRQPKGAPEETWQVIPVCARVCQPQFPPSLFPPGTPGQAGGPWGR